MKHRRSLIDILDDVVKSMSFPITIYKIFAPTSGSSIISPPGTGNNYVLNVDNIYHAQIGYSVTIGGNIYEIVAVNNVSIACGVYQITINDASGTTPINFPTVNSFNLYTPFFFHGTPRETNAELEQQTQAFNKYPMIWLWEEFSEVFSDDQEEPHERESDIQLCFLTQADFAKLQDDMATLYVEPMMRLMESFIHKVNEPISLFDRIDLDYTVIRKNKFGVYIRGKGSDKSMFSDNCAGVILQVKLKLYEPGRCCS